MRPTSATLLVAILLGLAGSASAQLDRGSFTGTVTDSTAAVIAHVSVIVQNANTGATYKTVTSATGEYTIPNLPVGTYDVTFEAQGFSRSVHRGVSLEVAEIRRVDATLEIGAVTQSIEVAAPSARLQTDTADVSTTLQSRNMNDLPLDISSGGRVLEDLVYKLVPGAQGSAWSSSILGSQPFTNESLLEGATITTEMQGYWGEMAVSPEAVQEFKVQVAATSAEFGRSQGSVMDYVLKSGTNEIHGTAYGMLRNEALDANTFSNNFFGIKRPLDRRYDYAFSFGGPVTIPKVYHGRNKTFFYATVERYHEKTATFGAPSVTWPLPEFYAGNFSRLLGPATGFTDALGRQVLQGAIYDPASFYQLPNGQWVGQMFPGNIIPQSRFSKVAQNLDAIAEKDYVPPVVGPNGQIPLVNNASAFENLEYERSQLQVSAKMDENISDSQKLSGSVAVNKRPRWEMSSSNSMWNPNLPDGGPLSQAFHQDLLTPFVRIAHDWTVSPTKLNDFRVYFNRFHNWMDSPFKNIDGAQQLGIPNFYTPGYPEFYWGSGPFITLANPGLGGWYYDAVDTYGLQDTFNFSYKSHFMKAGFETTYLRHNYLGDYFPSLTFSPLSTSIPEEPFSGSYTGYSFASYLLGIVYSGSNVPPLPVTYLTHYYDWFIQDDWKVTKRLSLNLGVRWDYMSAMNEAHDRLSGWTPELTDPISGLPGAYAFAGNCPQCGGNKYLGQGSDNKFAPRIGFAYRLFSKTTLRGSYAIFYQGEIGTNLWGPYGLQTAWVSNWALTPNALYPWKGIFNLDQGLPANLYIPPSFNASWGDFNPPTMFDPKYPTLPQIMHWNFNIQHAFPGNFVLDVGYIGVKGNSISFSGSADTLAVPDQLQPKYLQEFGTKLLNPVLNAADAAANGIAYPYPGFQGTVASALRQYPQVVGNSTIGVIGSPIGFSTTEQLQVVLDKKFSSGLTAYANYVWSKTLTNCNWETPLDYYNLGLEKSIANYDVPHSFKAYIAYDLPVGKGKPFWGNSGKLVNGFFGGWAVSAILNYQSGLPLIFTTDTSPLAGAWNGGIRIDIASGDMLASGFNKANFNLANTASTADTYLNKSIYSSPPPLSLGTAAYAYAQARGFGIINEDIGLQKNFHISEKYRVQLRAEFLDAFNRHTLGGIITDVSSPLFGQVTGVSGNRSVQLGARVDF